MRSPLFTEEYLEILNARQQRQLWAREVERVVENLYQCILSTPMHQLGWKHHPHLSHTTDETAVDVLIYTIACCLGMCHAAAQHIQQCSMVSGWPQAGEHQSGFCVPKEKPFPLFRVVVCTRETHRVFAGM